MQTAGKELAEPSLLRRQAEFSAIVTARICKPSRIFRILDDESLKCNKEENADLYSKPFSVFCIPAFSPRIIEPAEEAQ